MRRAMLGAALLLLLAGCSVPPQSPTSSQPPRSPAGTGGGAAQGSSGQGQTGTPSPTFADSGPSKDALEVLGTIPDPLSAAERVPPPVVVGVTDTLESPAFPDTTGPDTTGTGIPTPEPTQALGERSPEAAAAGGAAGIAVEPAPSVAPPAAPSVQGSAAPPPAKPAAPDTCWRVQLAAPKQKDEAERKRQAAESLLLVPMVIDVESKLYKVRSRDCLDRAAADRLRERAASSGFDGAFRLAQPKGKR